ncbi:MAG: class I SAM-dependent methyltransferase [Muribaculaceae bacterium]|nr:class I SAM-dependent methyltransferase [Muribaculaceae bacterium]
MENIDWAFVEANLKASPSALRLKYHGKGRELEITQVECRQKFAKKLAETLADHPHLIFPSVLAGEQSTSDALACLHAGLVTNSPSAEAACGLPSAIDLTAGLGIDASHLAGRFRVTALELDPAKAEALRLNFGDILCVEQADCREFVSAYDGQPFDVAFIDPARRTADGGRAFALADCQPDVVAMLPALRHMARTLIVKVSPMLDITALASALPGTRRVIAYGTATECKELVAAVDLQVQDHPLTIEAVTVGRCSISFTPAEEREAKATIADSIEAGMRLYEPYPATMKAAPFNLLSERWDVLKLHPNTHLYVSTTPVDGFPGEEYVIEKVVPYESKHIKRLRREYPAIQVTCRNFDMAAEALRRQLAVKDAGPLRLFAAGTPSGRLMLICRASKITR